jgi:fucose permease
MPMLRNELQLTYTVAALHLSAYALGVLCAGFTGERVMRRLGLSQALWGCGSVVMCALLLVLVGHNAIVTIFGAWLVGLSGSTMGQTSITLMAERFQEERTIAITESNIASSTFSSIAPIVVGVIVHCGQNWRMAFAPLFLMFGILYLIFKDVAEPFADHSKLSDREGKLALPYWAFWTVILFSVAGEWSIVFWCSDYMQQVARFSKADASASTSVFLIAIIAGRLAGTRLARSVPVRQLLPIAAVIGLSGFFIFWLGKTPALNFFGLFLAGFGNSNVYPMTFSQAIGSAPGKTSLASARMSVAAGTANLIAPLVMGFIADRSGILVAYGLVAVLWTSVIALVIAAERISHRTETA